MCAALTTRPAVAELVGIVPLLAALRLLARGLL